MDVVIVIVASYRAGQMLQVTDGAGSTGVLMVQAWMTECPGSSDVIMVYGRAWA